MPDDLKTRVRQLRGAEQSRRRAKKSYDAKKENDPTYNQRGRSARQTSEAKARYNEQRRAKAARDREINQEQPDPLISELVETGHALIGKKGLTAPLYVVIHSDGRRTYESLNDALPTWEKEENTP